MGEIMIRTLSSFVAPALALPRAVKHGSVSLAFYLRLVKWVSFSGPMMWVAVVSVVLDLPVFIASGLYRAIFRYMGYPP
jgi:hypothetical protein